MKTLTREQAIDDIRTAVLRLVDDDHSMCEVAGKLGIYCRGFRRLDDDDLFRRYEWLAERRGVSDRGELEDLANRWQLARQLVTNHSLSCDVQAKEGDGCVGWLGFTDAQLEDYHRSLCGEEIAISSQPAAGT